MINNSPLRGTRQTHLEGRHRFLAESRRLLRREGRVPLGFVGSERILARFSSHLDHPARLACGEVRLDVAPDSFLLRPRRAPERQHERYYCRVAARSKRPLPFARAYEASRTLDLLRHNVHA